MSYSDLTAAGCHHLAVSSHSLMTLDTRDLNLYFHKIKTNKGKKTDVEEAKIPLLVRGMSPNPTLTTVQFGFVILNSHWCSLKNKNQESSNPCLGVFWL